MRQRARQAGQAAPRSRLTIPVSLPPVSQFLLRAEDAAVRASWHLERDALGAVRREGGIEGAAAAGICQTPPRTGTECGWNGRLPGNERPWMDVSIVGAWGDKAAKPPFHVQNRVLDCEFSPSARRSARR